MKKHVFAVSILALLSACDQAGLGMSGAPIKTEAFGETHQLISYVPKGTSTECRSLAYLDYLNEASFDEPSTYSSIFLAEDEKNCYFGWESKMESQAEADKKAKALCVDEFGSANGCLKIFEIKPN